MNYQRVKDYPNLVRDKRNKAILNTSTDELNKYHAERDSKFKLNKAIEEVDNLKQDVHEIKQLLNQLISKL